MTIRCEICHRRGVSNVILVPMREMSIWRKSLGFGIGEKEYDVCEIHYKQLMEILENKRMQVDSAIPIMESPK